MGQSSKASSEGKETLSTSRLMAGMLCPTCPTWISSPISTVWPVANDGAAALGSTADTRCCDARFDYARSDLD